MNHFKINYCTENTAATIIFYIRQSICISYHLTLVAGRGIPVVTLQYYVRIPRLDNKLGNLFSTLVAGSGSSHKKNSGFMNPVWGRSGIRIQNIHIFLPEPGFCSLELNPAQIKLHSSIVKHLPSYHLLSEYEHCLVKNSSTGMKWNSLF